MTHQTRRPPRPEWREQAQTRVTKHEYYCWRGEHWFELEQADYCDDCGTPLFPDLESELVHPGSPDEDEHNARDRVVH